MKADISIRFLSKYNPVRLKIITIKTNIGVTILNTGSIIDSPGQKFGRKVETTFESSEILMFPLEKNLLVMGKIGFFSKIKFLK